LPPTLLPKRWALTPPFHPYLRCAPFEDVPEVFLSGYHRDTLRRRYILCGTFREAVVSGRIPWRYQARCPTLLSQSGVRTFLPPTLPPPSGELKASQRSSSSSATSIILCRSALAAMRSRAPIQSKGSGLASPGCSRDYLVETWTPESRLSLPYFAPMSFSNSASLRMVTPNSFALSYFEPGSVPTTT